MKFSSLVVERAEARSRLRWIVLFRFIVLIGCLLALGLRRGAPSFEPVFIMGFWALLAGCLLNAAHAWLIRTARRPAWWGLGQILLDVLLISFLIYLTGGVLSYFNVLYFAAILSTSVAVSGRSGVFLASVCTVLLSVVSTAYFLGDFYKVSLPLVPRQRLEEVIVDIQFVLSYLLAQGIAFHVVAFLSLWLERRARRSELLQETLLRDISEGVIALDDKGRFLYINDEARKMLGFPPLIPIAGKHWDQVFRRTGDSVLRALLFSRQPMRRTIELERGGTKLLVNVKTSLLMDESRQRVIAVLGDLTIQQRAVEAERRADRLENVAEMAASMAHELRNPLTSIRACVQELGRLQPVDEDTRKLIEIVCRESDRLDGIIGDFLNFARMRSPVLRRGDAAETVRDVALLLGKRMKHPRCSLKLELQDALPCVFDAEQLHQALMNIGGNAVEAVAGGGEVRIVGRTLNDRDPGENVLPLTGSGMQQGVEIVFSDTGGGIPAENMERIFTPFFTTKKAGTGLGLPVASRIIKAHGGRIDVSSVPGRGSTFSVWLPPAADVPSLKPGPEGARHECGN